MDEDLLNDLDDLVGDDAPDDVERDANEGDADAMDEEADGVAAMVAEVNSLSQISKFINSRALRDVLQKINTFGMAPRTAAQNTGPVEDDPEYKTVVAATNISVEMDNEILVVHKFIRDKYAPRFPELESLIPNAYDYARTVKLILNETDLMKLDLKSLLPSATVMIVTVTATTTNGRQLTDEELDVVSKACDIAFSLETSKRKIIEYIESRMSFIAPNLSNLLNSGVAAKLMGVAGGLTALSKIPSCNIQVLGKSAKAVTGLLAKGQEKHAGFIYYCDFVQRLPKEFRNKATRMIAAKCCLAARVDRAREHQDGSLGRQFREEVEKKLEKAQEPPPGKSIKALAVPDEGPRSRRGGKRVRKMKERLAVTEAWKAQNRMKFGEAEEEVISGDTVLGLGLLGKETGKVRIQADANKKLNVAKKHRMIGGSSGSTSGLSSSLAFTPIQGIELENPEAAAAKKEALDMSSKYFGNLFFNKKPPVLRLQPKSPTVMAPRIIDSPFPDVHIPDVDVHTHIFAQARKHPKKTAFIDPATNEAITFGDVIRDVDACVSGLINNVGFKKWDTLAIFSPNCVDYAIAVHAVIKAGGTITTANPSYVASELMHQLTDADASILITNKELLPVALQAAAAANIPKNKVFLFSGAEDGFKGFRDIFSTRAPPTIKFTKEELYTRPAYLCYSSGTTGRSKGVETTHINMVANTLQFKQFSDLHGDFQGDMTYAGILPFYHIYGLYAFIHMSILNLHSVVVVPKFDFESYLKIMAKYKVTVSHIVPPVAVALAKSPLVDGYKFPHLKFIMSAAAPLGIEVGLEVSRRLGVPIVQGYGMTEMSPLTHMMSPTRPVPGASGQLGPSMQCRLVSPTTGQDVALGEEGEVWVRGPNRMKGYRKNPKATAETIDDDGWLHTGDVAYMDKHGFFYIVDRIKELIKYKGLQVAPAELEAVLLTHPAIADAAVIPRPDERAGEVPRAYVVLKPNAKATESEIRAFVEGKVAQHKRLRGGVAFIAEVPKSASGKILRRMLRAQDAEERKALAAKSAAKL
ncbi:hypothetical protein HK101_007402 [Irineochytrium annulatum]|nr:hypothetical protein HK101_007402 [Irineochytrium annulatum]